MNQYRRGRIVIAHQNNLLMNKMPRKNKYLGAKFGRMLATHMAE